MRILYLIDSLAGGGAESVLTNLIHYLALHKPQIICDVATLYPTAEKYLADKDFSVHCLNLDSKYAFNGISRLRSLVASERYEIVHTHLFPANYYAAIVSRLFPDPIWVYTEHSVWNRRRRFQALRLVETAIYSRFERIVAVSELVATSLRQWLPALASRVMMIPNGVIVPPFQQRVEFERSAKELTILYAGRLEHVKGVDVLLRAFADLTLPVILLIAGTGSQRAAFEQLAVELGISERVKFLGFRSDLAQLMTKVNCMVLPSRWEGLPMVVLEAMALGTPVIASAVGGIPEVIEDGITGWLVPPEDADRLAGILFQTLSNTEKAQSVALAAHARIKRDYSVEVLAQKTLVLYEELLNRCQ